MQCIFHCVLVQRKNRSEWKSAGFRVSKDNTGENISNKNAAYCELTGLYWAWKNLDTDYTGLAHYRRHFGKKTKAPFEGVLTYNELRPMLEKYKIFVPKKESII